jgi:hypothetical protein
MSPDRVREVGGAGERDGASGGSTYRAALQGRPRDRVLLQWAMSTGNQGVILTLLAERIGDVTKARSAVPRIETRSRRDQRDALQAVMARYLIQDHRFLDSFLILLGAALVTADTFEARLRFGRFIGAVSGEENTPRALRNPSSDLNPPIIATLSAVAEVLLAARGRLCELFIPRADVYQCASGEGRGIRSVGPCRDGAGICRRRERPESSSGAVSKVISLLRDRGFESLSLHQ